MTRPVPGMGSESVGPKGHIGFCLPVFRSRAPGPAEYEKNPASSSLPAPGQRDLYFLTPAGVSPAGQARSIESTEQDSNLQRPKATDLQSACVSQFAYLSIERSGSFPGPLFFESLVFTALRLLCRHGPVPGREKALFSCSCKEYLRRGSNPQKTRILSPAHIPILLQRHILLWCSGQRPGCGHAAKYSRRDSNPHCTGPGPASSANWDYGSRYPPANKKAACAEISGQAALSFK